MEIETLMTLVNTVGVPVMIIVVLIYGVAKLSPKIINAYKECNTNLVNSINKLSESFTQRLEKIEDKVDNIQKAVDNLKEKEK